MDPPALAFRGKALNEVQKRDIEETATTVVYTNNKGGKLKCGLLKIRKIYLMVAIPICLFTAFKCKSKAGNSWDNCFDLQKRLEDYVFKVTRGRGFNAIASKNNFVAGPAVRGGGGFKDKGGTKSLLAYQQSHGLFDDISDLMWERMRSSTKSKSLYWNVNNPLDKIDNMEFWNAHNPRPNFICPHTVALGQHNQDGVKYLCYPKRLSTSFDTNLPGDDSSCLIYSFGCAGDFKFEDEIHKLHGKKCETHVFDPAKKWERKGDAENKNIHYHPWGLMSTYDSENKSKVWPAGYGGAFKTLPEIMKELGHEQKSIDVFKIDCEGCEWSTYKDWIGLDIRQILVEMHGVPTPEGMATDAITKKFFQKDLDVSEFYNTFTKHGYALYNRDEHGAGPELSFVKLESEFWE